MKKIAIPEPVKSEGQRRLLQALGEGFDVRFVERSLEGDAGIDAWFFQDADRIIGFNSLRFDIPVLQSYTQIPLLRFNHLDILDEVKKTFGKRISLNDIVKETLGIQKTDIGINAVNYWNKGDRKSLEKLQKYCESDVLLTRDIYDFAVKNKNLRFKDKWNSPREIEVDFSYPREEDTNTQIGLF